MFLNFAFLHICIFGPKIDISQKLSFAKLVV